MNRKTAFLRDCAASFLAAAVMAFGMYNIHAVSRITEGGVLGATLLMQYWFGISPAVSSFVLNALCYFLGWRTFGRRFLLFSGIAALGYSCGYALCELAPPLWPGIAGCPLAAALLGALFVGVCTGVCVRIGGAICGDDALAMSLSHLIRLPIQYIYLASDLTVLLLSLSYIPLGRIVYSLLTVTLSGQIIGFLQKRPKS